jgi:murein DD-endopeptidase MepM/ murein hydrolase activator NlpD
MSRKRYSFHLVLVLTGNLWGCAQIPKPPPPPGQPVKASFQLLRLEEVPADLTPPRPTAPRLRWTPAVPGEGTIAAFTIEPESRGLPVFEVRARSGNSAIQLAPLPGGAYLGLIAAPLNRQSVEVIVSATLVDGTRLSQDLTLLIARRDFPATQLRVARRFTEPDPESARRIQRERDRVRAVLRTISDAPLWQGTFVLPVEGVTTSPYGQRRLFNNELRSRHYGLDIDGQTGDPVRAANSGRVALSADLYFNGNAVFIDHGLGFFTGYFHLSERQVFEGEWVARGTIIGKVGATGRVTGPHLHWSLYLGGIPLDPLSLLDPAFARLSERLPAPALWPARGRVSGSTPGQ